MIGTSLIDQLGHGNSACGVKIVFLLNIVIIIFKLFFKVVLRASPVCGRLLSFSCAIFILS